MPWVAAWLLVTALAWADTAKVPGLKRLGPHRYEIAESALPELHALLPQALDTARMTPHLDGQRFAGFRFAHIAKDSPFAAMGFRTGDVLTQVNQVVLDNPAKGFVAFQLLRDAQAWTVHVRRKKRALRLH
jgi:type II secretory pathway component PulC